MKIPSHLAIIMDGNGRWARLHGRERTFGHLRGARVAKAMIEHCANLGVQHLTLYAFSTENWLRPKHEVFFLMQLLARHMRKERHSLIRNNIRFTTVGDLARLPKAVQEEVRKTELETATNTGMHLVFALSYGSRQEITQVAKNLVRDVIAGRLSIDELDENAIQSRLETASMPDPDLIIRTSGEYRLSNFLLWQAAYSELYVTDTLWPEFTFEELEKAFQTYTRRERRFGRAEDSGRSQSATPLPESVRFEDINAELDNDLEALEQESVEIKAPPSPAAL